MSRPTATLLDVDGPLGEFAATLLAVELPGLSDAASAQTVAFICRRTQQIPGPLRLGVASLVALAATAARASGWSPVTRLLRTTSLPLLGELARLVRSLGFAYVWETWPDTAPDGSPTGAGQATTLEPATSAVTI